MQIRCALPRQSELMLPLARHSPPFHCPATITRFKHVMKGSTAGALYTGISPMQIIEQDLAFVLFFLPCAFALSYLCYGLLTLCFSRVATDNLGEVHT